MQQEKPSQYYQQQQQLLHNKQQGIPYNLILDKQEFMDVLSCASCHNLLKNPQHCSIQNCDAHYCRDCFTNLSICMHCKNATKACPPLKQITQLLDKIKLKCPYYEAGCTDILKYGVIEAHSKSCKFKFNKSQTRYKEVRIVNINLVKPTFPTQGYALFTIITKFTQGQYQVERRYNDFINLQNYLMTNQKYEGHLIPQLPPKEANLQVKIGLGNEDDTKLKRRRLNLQIYLQILTQNQLFEADEQIYDFLTAPTFDTIVKQSFINNIQGMVQGGWKKIVQKFSQMTNEEGKQLIDQNISLKMKNLTSYYKMIEKLTEIFKSEISKMENLYNELQVPMLHDFSENLCCIKQANHFIKFSSEQKLKYKQCQDCYDQFYEKIQFQKKLLEQIGFVQNKLEQLQSQYNMLDQELKQQQTQNQEQVKEKAACQQKINQISKIFEVELDNISENLSNQFEEIMAMFGDIIKQREEDIKI